MGYGLAPSPTGALAAWELKNQIYFARFDAQARRLSHLSLVGGEATNRKYPVVVANKRGQALVAWTEGVSWAHGGSVAWQLYDNDNVPTGPQGKSPGVPASSQVTVFARQDGSFAVVY